MTYIIRHVRFIQSVSAAELVKVFQMDGRLNPTDAFTKWLPHSTRTMFYTFMRGDPQRAYDMWVKSAKFKQFKPKKIVPEPDEALEVDVRAMGSSNFNDPAGIAAMTLDELKKYRDALHQGVDEVSASHRVSRLPVVEARIGALEKEAKEDAATRAAARLAQESQEQCASVDDDQSEA